MPGYGTLQNGQFHSRSRTVSEGSVLQPTTPLLTPSVLVRHTRPKWQIGTTTALVVSVLVQVANALVLMWWFPPSKHHAYDKHRSPGVVVITACLQSIQFLIVVLGTFLVLRSVWRVTLTTAFIMYLVTVLSFSGVYVFWAVTVSKVFAPSRYIREFDGGHADYTMPITMLYFSAVTQALVGFGDIAPNHPVTKVFAALQMIVGVVYNVLILGQVREAFMEKEQRPPGYFRSLARIAFLKRIRKLARRYLLAFSIVLQVLSYFVLAYDKHDSGLLKIVAALEVFLLLVIVSTSVKFVSKAYRVTINYLFQSYVSVVLCFGFIYSVEYLLWGEEDTFYLAAARVARESNSSLKLLDLIMQFCYFSLCVMTTIGYGDNFPTRWFTRVPVIVQILVGVVYSVAILGYGLSHLSTLNRAKIALQDTSNQIEQRIQRQSSRQNGMLASPGPAAMGSVLDVANDPLELGAPVAPHSSLPRPRSLRSSPGAVAPIDASPGLLLLPSSHGSTAPRTDDLDGSFVRL